MSTFLTWLAGNESPYTGTKLVFYSIVLGYWLAPLNLSSFLELKALKGLR